MDVKFKEVIEVNFLLPCWSASFPDRSHEKLYQSWHLSIKHLLINKSIFFFKWKNPSNKTLLLAPAFLLLKKISPAVWAGNQPLSAEVHERLCGVRRPPGTSTIEQQSQGGLHPLRHHCWYCAQSSLLGWGQQQADLSFPEPQRVVSQHRGGKQGEEYGCFRPAPQVCTDSPKRTIQTCNSLILRAYSVQGIQSQAVCEEVLGTAANP